MTFLERSAQYANSSPKALPTRSAVIPISYDNSLAVFGVVYLVTHPVMKRNESRNPISEMNAPIMHTAKLTSLKQSRKQNLYFSNEWVYC